ncbi:MAG: hypothetical protein H7Z37_18170, partial [Pyrinomonadaceae bacterium]|nr:hypothetical protein [Pyrinomonadaceae bacterium]
LRKFYVLLDDTRLPKDFNEICSFPVSRSSMAVGLLSRMMIENAPTKRHAYGSDKEIKIWKTWFEQNKQLIE